MEKPEKKGVPVLSSNKGMNLIEVLVAIVILSIGLLGTGSLILGVVRGNRVSKNVTISTTLAKDKIEEVASTSYSTLPSVDTTTTEDYNSITNFANFKRITKTFVNDPSTGMKRVVVEVHWQGGSNPVTLSSIFVRQ